MAHRSCDARLEVVAYNAVMSACEKGRDLPAAERIMEEIQFWARQPSERARGRIEPARHLVVLSCEVGTKNGFSKHVRT